MAKTKKQLINECITYGLPLRGTMDDLYDRLARHKCALQEVPCPELIMPMLAHTFKDKGLSPDARYVVEEKIDGVRAITYFTKEGVEIRLRGRSVHTYLPLEKSANVLWTRNFDKLDLDSLDGVVLDGELVCSTAELTVGKRTKTRRAATTALLNAAPELAINIQRQQGVALTYNIFDILRVGGDPTVWQLPENSRRALLERCYAHALYAHRAIRLVEQHPVDEASAFFDEILDAGGEGIMYKDVSAPYEPDTRSAAWLKRKRSIFVTAWVSGFTDATTGKKNEGLVGGLTFADADGSIVATVSSLTDATRNMITVNTDRGPALHPTMYGKKATLLGFDWSRNGLLEHARLVRWES